MDSDASFSFSKIRGTVELWKRQFDRNEQENSELRNELEDIKRSLARSVREAGPDKENISMEALISKNSELAESQRLAEVECDRLKDEVYGLSNLLETRTVELEEAKVKLYATDAALKDRENAIATLKERVALDDSLMTEFEARYFEVTRLATSMEMQMRGHADDVANLTSFHDATTELQEMLKAKIVEEQAKRDEAQQQHSEAVHRIAEMQALHDVAEREKTALRMQLLKEREMAAAITRQCDGLRSEKSNLIDLLEKQHHLVVRAGITSAEQSMSGIIPLPASDTVAPSEEGPSAPSMVKKTLKSHAAGPV